MKPQSILAISKRTVFIIAIIILLGIVFESFQQLYYVNRYQLSNDVTFFGLFKFQLLRWMVWLIFSIFIVVHSKKTAKNKVLKSIDLLKFFILIMALVILAITTISTLQLIYSDVPFSVHVLFTEYFPFFTFQKAPIYTLGYIAISIILYFHFTNEELQIKVQNLIDLKNSHLEEYTKLRSSIDDKAAILNIKVGNNLKIIPLDTIHWIEADDYCVKVHIEEGKSYSMRSSLKALEAKLDDHFLRVHRKAIVNMDKAKSLNNSLTPTLILKNGFKISVSKSNIKKVKDYIQSKAMN